MKGLELLPGYCFKVIVLGGFLVGILWENWVGFPIWEFGLRAPKKARERTVGGPSFPASRLVGTDRLSMSCICDLATKEIVGELLLGRSRVCVCFNVNLDIDIGCR